MEHPYRTGSAEIHASVKVCVATAVRLLRDRRERLERIERSDYVLYALEAHELQALIDELAGSANPVVRVLAEQFAASLESRKAAG